ncbi:response regulator [Mesorhizobium opportunistum]|uniref:response regulator n=1 Tax=Mesorhizobium opportunistum TaxID=593909 RepID=UPI003337FB11
MNAPRSLIAVVDDDESVRESLPGLLRVLGYDAQAFSSAKCFLSSNAVAESNCLVLDIAMPEVSGPELAEELRRMGNQLPIIFITAHRHEVESPRVQAQHPRACLLKPFSDTALANAVEAALRAV